MKLGGLAGSTAGLFHFKAAALKGESKKILITAGEISGDLNASLLIRAIKKIRPNTEFVGVGGARMKEAGVRLIADSTKWGSIGILEGAMKLPVVYPTLRAMPSIFAREKPDIYIPVDYRFFSIRAATVAAKMKIPVVYYFAPVSWFGTGGKRFAQMAGVVDLALLAFPFSLEDYKNAGIRAEYIGHPLIDAAKPSMTMERAMKHFGVDAIGKVVGFMPGSRNQEIGRLTPVFAKAAIAIKERMPEARFLLFPAAAEFVPLIKKRLGAAPVEIVEGNVYDFMNVCDALALCSGTATHEACIMEKPMVVTYMVSAFTAWLIRRTVDPKMIAMPNILSGRMIAPELVQEECRPESVAREVLRLLNEDEARTRMIAELGEAKAKLGEPGVAERAAGHVVRMLEAS